MNEVEKLKKGLKIYQDKYYKKKEQLEHIIEGKVCPDCKKWILAYNIETKRYWCPKDGYVLENLSGNTS